MIFDPTDDAPEPTAPDVLFFPSSDDFVPWRGTVYENATTEPDFTHEETYRLALESAERWLGQYRLSPAMRLRAIRAVVEAALSDQSVYDG